MPDEQVFDPNVGREWTEYLERWPNLAYKPAIEGWQWEQVIRYVRWLEAHVPDLEKLLGEPTE